MLSLFGSLFIICSMLITNSEQRNNNLHGVFDRLLLYLCISDVVFSTAYFFGSWSIPKSPPTALVEAVGGEEFWNEMYPHAIGNVGTCTAQGFFCNVGMWSSLLSTG